MSPLLLDGKSLSKRIEQELTQRILALKVQSQRTPKLATILVGDDPASDTYVRMKGNACLRVGMTPVRVDMPESSTTRQVLDTIAALNEDEDVHGILLQHPVPHQIDERACFDAIAPGKDVDGVTALGFGRMSLGDDVYGSATPTGIMMLLAAYGIAPKGKHAVVVGRSAILGKPMAMLLLAANATVTICHSHTVELERHVREADILIGAVGKPQFIPGEWVKRGAVVIDAGYHPGGVGDIAMDAARERCSAYTPVPGGVGPMTIAALLEQTVQAAEQAMCVAAG